jgi:GNAT superfamily N-acetyltransferase
VADASALARLYDVARPRLGLSAGDFRTWLALNSALLVEEEGDGVVAALRYAEEGDGWRVEPIVTHPDHRGQAYGRWLMTKVEADAIRTNVPCLMLTLTDPSVLPYYHRLGYRPTGEDPLELSKRVGGVWQRHNGTP